MALDREGCDRTFATKGALDQHLRDSLAYAVTFDCDECDRAFDTEQALQQHLRDSPAYAVTLDCDECDCAFDTEQTLQQHLRDLLAHVGFSTVSISQSFEQQPSLHDEVSQSLRAYDLAIDFFTSDDPHGTLNEHNTSITDRSTCTSLSRSALRRTSKQIAFTRRQYPKKRHNARVYFQRCKSYESLI